MSPNVPEFAWTGARLKAASLVAQDVLTNGEIGRACGVTEKTIERWKQRADFAARVESERVAIADAIRAEGIANKQNRIDSYRRDFDLTERVIAARAAAYAEAPGGDTGLLVGQLKLVRHVDTTDTEAGDRVWTDEVWEYAVDTALMNERLKLRKQVAQERGEWTEQSGLAVDLTATVRLIGVDPGDV